MLTRSLAFAVLLICVTSAFAQRTNVLFIAVDDLRPSIGCYGDANAITPNLDALAKRGLVFERAYCQQAVCSPSRTSLLTGLRPDTTQVYDLETHFRTIIPDVVTLPQHFKNNGYHAQGFGKIYHGALNDEKSWSVPWTPKSGEEYHDPKTLADIKQQRQKLRKANGDVGKVKGTAWEAADVKDEELPDGITTTKAIAAMRAAKGKPFFLAVGLTKPHLPFVAPKKYLDMHPAEKFKLPENDAHPTDAPGLAFTNFDELRGYLNVPKKGKLPDEQALALIRAYYAATTYTDANIGRLLSELDALGLRDNTIVIVWGDHGWHLGEQGQWCKHTNFENATHAPLIISTPSQKSAGQKTTALVEFVDIYPSLCELTRLKAPEKLEGTSFVPLIDSPARAWRTAAFSQYPRKAGTIMGYTMRTSRYRYTEWQDASGKAVEVELYDHESDPKETRNVAKASDAVVKELSQQLRRG